MDYKAVLEEQIRELQKVQDKVTENPGRSSDSCEIARAIKELVIEANQH
ncbi:MAG: hypothetical protein ACM3KR_01130 [Deltaproteobacteria bacterium]